jgi:hypothetical protein
MNPGVCIGLNAAIISIMSEWFSDIKMGYCSDAWWLSQQFCCWEVEGEEVDGCELWHTWSSLTLIRWAVFVLFAVRSIDDEPFRSVANTLIPTFRQPLPSWPRTLYDPSPSTRQDLVSQRSNASLQVSLCKVSWVPLLSSSKASHW